MTRPNWPSTARKVRAWLDEHKAEAPTLRAEDSGLDEHAHVAARREWQRKLAEGGLAAVVWPADYGGQGLGPLNQVVVNQEIGRAGVPGIFDVIGVGMLGPTLIAHGDEEQKQRHLGADAQRRRGVVPALLRARRGLGPRRHPDARQAGRRRHLAAHRPEGVDHERPARRLRAAARAHRRRRAQAQGPDHVHRPDGRAGRDDPPAAPDLGRGALQRGLLRRRRARRRLRGRPGQRRLGRRHDHADVRARRDRPRRRGLRLARGPLRGGAAGRRGRHARPRGAPPLRRDRRRLPRPALHRLPDAHHAAARRHPRPGGRAREGHHDQGRDRRRRAAGRRARARRASATPTGASSSPTSRASSPRAGRRRSCATWSASACSACHRSHGWTRASRSPSCAPRSARQPGRRHELRADRRAGVPQGGRARRALALQDRRGGARGARRRRAARPLADRAGGRLGRAADLGGARRRRAVRDGGHAGLRRARARARGRRPARPPARHVPARARRRGVADVLEGARERRAAGRLPAGAAAERHRGPSGPSTRGWARSARAAPTVGEDGIGDRRGRLGARRARGRPVRRGRRGRPRGARQGRRRHRRGRRELRPDPLGRPRQLRRRARHAARPRRRGRGGGLVRRPGVPGGGVARRGRGRARGLGPVRQGALHLRARDRLLPGGQARPRGDPAAQRELALAHVLHGLGGPGQAGGVPGRGVGVPARRGPRARPRRARPDLRPRRHRRDVGARRAAVLPPRPALPAAAGRHGGRRRPRGRRAARRRARASRRPRTSRRVRSAAAAPCAVCSGRWSRRPC